MSTSRRKFIKQSCALAAVAAVPRSGNGWFERARRQRDKIRITNVERFVFYLPYHDFHAKALFRYHGPNIQARTVFKVSTNVGLVGWGESWSVSPFSDEDRRRYVGSSPFDWLAARKDLPMNMAAYDLMGKYLEIPAWKMIGPQVRTRIPVAAWTVSQEPEALQREVKHAASLGYRWIKYHIDEIQNVLDQTRAMQEVAPKGFRVHFDFNVNSTLSHVEPILREMEKFPVVGRIEDPIRISETEGWRHLTETCKSEILVHHGPAEFMNRGLCDGSMAGHAPIGSAIRVAALADSAGLPFMLQQCGGFINQAFLAHEASVFPQATLDHCNLALHWNDHVCRQPMPVVDGMVDVPRGPGLGIEVVEEKVRHAAELPPPAYEPFLVKIMYTNGPTIVARHLPHREGHTDDLRIMKRLLGDTFPGPQPGYNNPVRSEMWDDLDDPLFQKIWKQTENQRYVVL